MEKPDRDEDRRSDLRRYLIKCASQNIISLDELKRSPMVVLARLGKTLLEDVTALGGEARDDLGTIALEAGASTFLEMARTLGKRKKR